MEIHTIVIIVITLLLSGFFSGMEIAFVSADRLKFEIDKQKKTITTSIISFLFKNPQQFISTILVGNNIAIVIYGIEMAVVLEEPLASISDNKVVLTLLQTVISTAIVLFTGEFLPKTIFRINPNL
jgi:CBS domain containing-hemolysin-like protein